MSYKALYRKYRPATFEEVKGQDHIVKTLKNIIESDKIGHAYIFSGPRGVGKTSVAKIFANVVNCNHSEIKTKACSECLSDINNNIDVIEMDAASNNGVDDIRELKDKVELLPTKGKYKIYIIDEVHMLSKGAFNALLKTLEEPPTHAIFILATTDPQKIPLTILSRSQRFNFRRIPNFILNNQIKDVLKSENISYEEESINYISRLAAGGMRDALSIADQSAMYGLGSIKLQDLIHLFGIVSNSNLIKILNASYQGNVKEVISIFSDLRDSGMDALQFISGLINVSKDFIVFNATRDPNFLETLELEEVETIKSDNEFVVSYIEKLYTLLSDLYKATSPFQIIEFGLINFVNKKVFSKQKFDQNTYEQDEFIKNKNNISNDFNPSNQKSFEAGELAKNAEKQPILGENPQKFSKKQNNLTNEPMNKENPENQEGEQEDLDFNFNPNVPSESEYEDYNNFFEVNKISIANTEEIDLEVPKKRGRKRQVPTSVVEVPVTAPVVPEISKEQDKKSEEIIVEFEDVYDVDQIINAMVQSSLNFVNIYKDNLRVSESVVEMQPWFKEVSDAFLQLKILCANENYMVASSKDIEVLNKIKQNQNNAWLQNYVHRIFGDYKTIMPVSRKVYNSAVEKIKAMKAAGQKPDIIRIEVPKSVTEASYEVEMGRQIFGKDIDIKEEKSIKSDKK